MRDVRFFSRLMTAWTSAAVGTRRATVVTAAGAGAAGAAATTGAGAAALGAAATFGALVVGGVVTLGLATVVAGAAVVGVGSGAGAGAASATWATTSPAWRGAGAASSSTWRRGGSVDVVSGSGHRAGAHRQGERQVHPDHATQDPPRQS